MSLPKIYPTDVLTEKQLEFIATKLPAPCRWTGRLAYSNRELLPGILRVLRSGCRWRDLNLPDYPDGSTHWRRLQFWRQGKQFRLVWQMLLRMLRQAKQLCLDTLSIDGSLVQSFAFKEATGYSGKHHRTGTKISTIADATIPIALVTTAKGNIVDISIAYATIDNIRVAKSAVLGSDLLADKGYDCLDFRKYITNFGIMPYIPKRRSTKPKDNNCWYYLFQKEKCKKRYVIEQTNAWLKSFRRLRMRFDYHAASFEAFLYLAIIIICVRRLLP